MDYNSIVFREFTHESLERIQRYRQEEAERIACEEIEQERICVNDNDKRGRLTKSSEGISTGLRRVPNKELAVGQTLPRLLQTKFPNELIGKAIEEIDNYYRGESVCVIF